jgi:putative N6-adenine-specific DNA methylase
MSSSIFTLFAVCPPGIEPLLADELRERGLAGKLVAGGVEIEGSLEMAARVNLWSRIASRVLVRLGAVRATAFSELVKKARALPFDVCLRRGPGAPPLALRVTCRKSRLYHSDAVAERLHAAVEARLGGSVALAAPGHDDEDAPADQQLIVARFDHDVCTVSADASGALLHRRGWRERGGRAPLRETLAAALLRAAGFRGLEGSGPLLDPLCGSGTIAIEAALLARRRAPGIGRSFELQRWPAFDAKVGERLLAEARAQELPRSPVRIAASDIDAGAIAIARENAQRAGVLDDLQLSQRPLALLEPPAGAGVLIANAPYGVRIGATNDQSRLFVELGELARSRLRGWRIALLAARDSPARAAGLAWSSRLKTQNGGIPVELLVAQP